MIYLKKKICMSCRTFRLVDTQSGLCRVDKTVEHYPMKTIEDSCEKWVDGGHQYNIRKGWVKSTLKKERNES